MSEQHAGRSPAEYSEAAIDAAISDLGGAFKILKDRLPEDYQLLVHRLSEIMKSGLSAKDATELAYNELGAVRRKYALVIVGAPDANLKSYLEVYAKIHETIYLSDGYQLCNKLAEHGAIALVGKTKFPTVLYDQLATHFFEAVAKAIVSPSIVSEPIDKDWSDLWYLMRVRGASDEYLEIIASGAYESEDTCPSLIAFLSALSEMPGEEGRRLRAYVVSGISRS